MSEPRFSTRRHLQPDSVAAGRFHPAVTLAVRIALAAAFVILCYQFDWILLRQVTAECIFRLSQFLNLGITRSAADSVQLNSIRFQFTVNCTQIDVFCGAIPLVWNRALSIPRNVAKLGIFFVCLFAFNILRLQVGYVLFAGGAPWILAHEVVAGVNLFLIFLWVVRQTELRSALYPMSYPANVTT
jgi:hypothetical protein